MLTDDTEIPGVRIALHHPVTKGDVKQLARMLFQIECQGSIVPNDKVKAELASELVAYLLAP